MGGGGRLQKLANFLLGEPAEGDEQEVAGGGEVPGQRGDDTTQGARVQDGGACEQGGTAEPVQQEQRHWSLGP